MDLDSEGDLDVLPCEDKRRPEEPRVGVIWYEKPHRTNLARGFGELRLLAETVSRPADSQTTASPVDR